MCGCVCVYNGLAGFKDVSKHSTTALTLIWKLCWIVYKPGWNITLLLDSLKRRLPLGKLIYSNSLFLHLTACYLLLLLVWKQMGLWKENVQYDMTQRDLTRSQSELDRLLTNCNPLLIPNYMTKNVVSNIIHYITHFR